jgi:pilus assembly protein CpaC
MGADASLTALARFTRAAACSLIFTCFAGGAHSAPTEGDAGSRTPLVGSRSTPIEEIVLQLGEQRTLPTDNVRNYSEAVKGIVDVRMTKDASQFVIVALRPGTTTLLLIMMDGSERYYRIRVADPEAPQQRRGGAGTVEARDNIRLDFYFVQLSKNYGHQLGIGWPGSIAPTGSATFDLKAGSLDSATAVIANQALPRLDIAQASGWAKVMRQAAVVTANGEKASFAGGGEVNVAIQSALTTGVQKIQFGSEIQVEPEYDAKTGRVELRLHADVSELESDRGTGVPGRSTATLDTVVNLELGQSLILGGLTARSERSSKSGLPGLSQIPILGLFFGSSNRSEDETENVVIIVPSVIDAVSMQARARLTEALRAYADYDGNLERADLVPAVSPPQARGARKR